MNSQPTDPHPASRQLLVAFQELPAESKRQEIWKKHGVREVEQISRQPLFLVEAPPDTEATKLRDIQKAIASESGVRYAEPNIQMKTFQSGQ